MVQATLPLFESALPDSHTAPADTKECSATDWTTDPAELDFLEYRTRRLLGPAHGCVNRPLPCNPFPFTVEQRLNHYPDGEDLDYGSWESALDVGRSYLVGSSVPMEEFLRAHTSPMTLWQQTAYEWCIGNPSRLLVFTSTKPRRIFHISKRGEYIEIALPHRGHGGTKYWISRDAKTRVLIKVD